MPRPAPSARHSTSLHTAHGAISPKTRARRHAAGVTPSQSGPSRLPKVARVGPRRSMHRGSGIDPIERGSERAVARGDARGPRNLPLTGSCPTSGPRDVADTVARERIAVGMGGGRSLHPTSRGQRTAVQALPLTAQTTIQATRPKVPAASEGIGMSPATASPATPATASPATQPPRPQPQPPQPQPPQPQNG